MGEYLKNKSTEAKGWGLLWPNWPDSFIMRFRLSDVVSRKPKSARYLHE